MAQVLKLRVVKCQYMEQAVSDLLADYVRAKLIRQSFFWSFDAIVVIDAEDHGLEQHFLLKLLRIIAHSSSSDPLVFALLFLESIYSVVVFIVDNISSLLV
jgi:hypothetical protein